MLEPTDTPTPRTTPLFWLDQIDVAVELPMGPPGVEGPPGTAWHIGPGETPPTEGDYQEGDLFLGSDGRIHRWDGTQWVDTKVDLIPDASELAPHDHAYLPLSGGHLSGPLTGMSASFTGNVVVPTPDAPTEAVNVDFLNSKIGELNLQRFFGDTLGNAIRTANSWNTAQGQAIYQQTDGLQLPPGVTGATTGITMRQSGGNLTQLICDLPPRNLWFVRTQVGNVWGQWSTLSPIVSPDPPLNPPLGPAVPNGTIWIQTDLTVEP